MSNSSRPRRGGISFDAFLAASKNKRTGVKRKQLIPSPSSSCLSTRHHLARHEIPTASLTTKSLRAKR